jgi:hypothetical protein
MTIFLIGIDDTDNDTSPGTGQIARRLAREFSEKGVKPLGITRHQFLVDPRIPYTSHNSGACIAVECDGPDKLQFAIDWLSQQAAPGSDPGICIAARDQVPSAVTQWGWAATREVLTKERALNLANENNLLLRPLGGTGDGIIGALASVGLRSDGNEGRFLDLPGLRELSDLVEIHELTGLGIRVDHATPTAAQPSAKYKTFNWVRPRLIDGRPVWPVEWSDDERAWIPVDRKKSRPLE